MRGRNAKVASAAHRLHRAIEVAAQYPHVYLHTAGLRAGRRQSTYFNAAKRCGSLRTLSRPISTKRLPRSALKGSQISSLQAAPPGATSLTPQSQTSLSGPLCGSWRASIDGAQGATDCRMEGQKSATFPLAEGQISAIVQNRARKPGRVRIVTETRQRLGCKCLHNRRCHSMPVRSGRPSAPRSCPPAQP
jgi:hypothetical protein